MTTVDIRSRLIASLIPFNTKFHQLYKDKPDLYGPFWVYTTLVIMLAVAGNLSRYMQMDNFTYNFNFIPVAATVLYCMALGLPMALKLVMRFVGVELFNGTFIEVREISSNFAACRHLWVLLHLIPDNLFRVCLPHSNLAVVLHRLLRPHLGRLLDPDPLARPWRSMRRPQSDRP